jgi:DNA-directed RNA polymerase beta subunit
LFLPSFAVKISAAPKAFALGARVTLLPPAEEMRALGAEIQSMVLPLDAEDGAADAVYVIFNGEMVGLTRDPEGVVRRLRARAHGRGSSPYDVPTVYVSPCGGHVYVYHDEGRVMRPLLVVRDGRLPDAGTDAATLFADRCIRYMDAAEVSSLDVALVRRPIPAGTGIGRRGPNVAQLTAKRQRGVEVDLMEVHAHLILGVTAALIPFLQATGGRRGTSQATAAPSPTKAPATRIRRAWDGRRSVRRCRRARRPIGVDPNKRPSSPPPHPHPRPRHPFSPAGGTSASGPFELSPALCYAQQPLCPATAPNTAVQAMECGLPLGQNLVVVVCPYGGCIQSFRRPGGPRLPSGAVRTKKNGLGW